LRLLPRRQALYTSCYSR